MSEPKRYIYAVYQNYGDKRPEVYRAEIVAQTAKFITIDGRPLAFGCRKKIAVDHACMTPEAAVRRYVEPLREAIADLQKRLKEAEALTLGIFTVKDVGKY